MGLRKDLVSLLMFVLLQEVSPRDPKNNSHDCQCCVMVANHMMHSDGQTEDEDGVVHQLEEQSSFILGVSCDEVTKRKNKLIDGRTMEQICVDVALCNRTSEATAASALSSVKSVGGEVTCELCKIAISALHQVFSEASIEDDVKLIVLELCVYARGLKQLCSAVINDHWETVWHLILSEVEPNVICPLFFKDCDQEYVNKLPHQDMIAASQTSHSFECDTCALIANFMKQMMDRNKSEAEAVEETSKVCIIFQDTVQQIQCFAIVQNDAMEIWNKLKEDEIPEHICVAMALCNRTSETTTASDLSSTSSVGGEVTCELCQMAISDVHHVFAEAGVEDDVKLIVLELCVYAGGLKQLCSAVINDHWETVWHLILSEVEPDVICPLLFEDCH